MNVRQDYGDFDELITGLYKELRKAAQRKTYQLADAEDLLQNTILKAYKGFGNFQQGSNFRAWMYRILATTAIDMARHKQSRVTEATLTEERERLAPAEGSAESVFIDSTTDPLLDAAIQSLPEGHRNVLWAIVIDGCSYQQVADRYGIPMGTVMSRYNRARNKAAKFMAENADVDTGIATP